MSKYKKGLVSDIKAEKVFEKKQEDLKDKYNIKDSDKKVVVVEKSNAYKFTVNLLIGVIKTAATICILILASVGLLTLIYPESRNAFSNVLNEISAQVSNYLPFKLF